MAALGDCREALPPELTLYYPYPALFMTLLLQSPIRCSDKPAAGGLALGLSTYCTSTPQVLWAPRAGLTTRLGDFATNCHE